MKLELRDKKEWVDLGAVRGGNRRMNKIKMYCIKFFNFRAILIWDLGEKHHFLSRQCLNDTLSLNSQQMLY